jgi:DNA-binding XRE family transcriptional regulator
VPKSQNPYDKGNNAYDNSKPKEEAKQGKNQLEKQLDSIKHAGWAVGSRFIFLSVFHFKTPQFCLILHTVHFHGKEVDRMQIRLWETRTSKGFTLMELARKSGIGKSTLNNIENGKVSPTLFQLETIAIALDVKITDLFDSEYK